ncbi:MAG TPA: AhpC/TSA family protein [Chloroflexi bacterium]|nr:AhpC/TSA family protein [Chloroflexota bacterium]
MKRLKPGEKAPDFEVTDLNSDTVRLVTHRESRVLLSFFRYATCPFCTVRFARLSQEAARLAEQGVNIIVVFESERDYLRSYLGSRPLPFPVIPDPEGHLYASYGLQKSVLGMMLGMFRLPTLMKALLDPQYQMARPDASVLRLPADFLIDKDGTVVESHYGRDIGDHIAFDHLEAFAVQPAQEAIQ